MSSDPTKLGLLPVEQFTPLEIPVADFEETDVLQIHRARSTGTMALLAVVLEMIGYGSRVAKRTVMEIFGGGGWCNC